MKRWIVVFLLMVPLLASAESYWEGNAALQRGDTAFESGLYAASNSFPPDTQLTVTNLETSRSTAATVSGRIEGQSDILILLSPKAADAIGLASGSIARVRITVTQMAPTEGASAAERPYNPDTDVNPAAAYEGKPNTPAEVAQQPAASDQQSTAATGQQEASGQAAEDAQILSEAQSRSPQKQLFLPPREDQKFALNQQPAQTGTQPVETSQTPVSPTTETPAAGQPEVSGGTGAPSAQTPEVPLAQAQPQSPATPEEAAGSPAQPQQGEAGAQLALPETGGQAPVQTETSKAASAPASATGGEKLALQAPESPPEQASQAPAVQQQAQGAANPPENPKAVENQPGQVQVVSTLPRLKGKRNAATFYVQVGAYATQEVAQSLAVSLVKIYPVVVLTPASSEKQMYKVLVGPLNRAESGTLLPVFKFRGFRDAFVRRE